VTGSIVTTGRECLLLPVGDIIIKPTNFFGWFWSGNKNWVHVIMPPVALSMLSAEVESLDLSSNCLNSISATLFGAYSH